MDVINDAYSYNTTFINCSYDISKETVNESSTLTRKWYYRVYTNDTSGNNVIAQVNATNKTGNFEFSIDTNSSGWTNITNITDYVSNGTRTYYSNYTIRAYNSSYETSSHTYNASLGNNLYDYFTFLPSVLLTNCSNLTLANTLYILNNNIVNHQITDICMNISAQNITLNCQGYAIYSIKNVTAVFSNQLNTTVKNCNITMGGTIANQQKFNASIYFFGANYSNIINNNVTSKVGIYLLSSSNNTLINNKALGNQTYSYGIFLNYSSNNTLINNKGESNLSRGIWLYNSQNNILMNNTGVSDSYYGIRLEYSNNNILINNTGISNITNSVGIGIYYSNNTILINNFGISNTAGRGIFITGASTNYIRNITLINNTGRSRSYIGISVDFFDGGSLINNTGTSNSSYGIALFFTNNTIWTSNTGTSNSSQGVRVYLSNNNTLINTQAIGYLAESTGFFISSSNNTLIQDCINVSGILLDVNVSGWSYNTTFLNCSYNISKEIVNITSTLFRQWYYRAYANDTDGNDVIAEINATNRTGGFEF